MSVTEKLRADCGYDEDEDTGIDSLIDYKNTLEELVDRIDQVMLANAGLADYHMSAADVTGALYGMGFGEAAATPVVTLREHPDAADNTVADACEHCGLFSCSGECQDDDV